MTKIEIKFEIELLAIQPDRIMLRITKPEKEIEYIVLDKGNTLNLIAPIEISSEQSNVR